MGTFSDHRTASEKVPLPLCRDEYGSAEVIWHRLRFRQAHRHEYRED